jgi:NADPH-dependent curcumin reductase CurA
MEPTMNRQYRLAARPVGLPKSSDWEFRKDPVPEPGDGQVLVRNLYVSLDPAMRGWMNEGRSYVEPVKLGDVMRAGAVGKVVASRDPKLAVGDYVTGIFGVQDYAVVPAKHAVKIDPALAPLPTWLGGLGLTGMTAYFGLLEIGHPKEGETVLVSGAAGATGSAVGQIAKIKGCRTVGIAGGPDKCRELTETFGFDAAIDYKAGDVRAAIRQHCPKGVDVFFDNVGGETLDAALANLALHARVVICGAISQYNASGPMRGPSNYMALLVQRARMEGFVVFDFQARYPEAVRAIATWRAEGRIKLKEDIVDGLETFPEALHRLFRGENHGKLMIKVADA